MARETRASFTETVRELKLGLPSEKQGGGFQVKGTGGSNSAGVWSEEHLGLARRSGLCKREAEDDAEKVVWV